MISAKQCIPTIFLLLIITQLTRFENQITIEYYDENLTIKINEISETFHATNYNFSSISATAQYSMAMQGGITDVLIFDNNSKSVYEFDPPVIYLFGRDWLGNMLTSTPLTFKTTFGDWYLDQFDSPSIRLYEKTLPKEFTISITFAGRGRKTLFLEGNQSIWIGFADGYIDSGFGYCVAEKCKSSNLIKTEKNALPRLANLLAESTLIVLIILLLVSLLSPKKVD